LPTLLIATVDKFAAMPWTGDVRQFFGRVDRYDQHGFYGPCHPLQGQRLPVDRLLPPDLIIQDELHLISGPLGTMVGLYETALDVLCSYKVNGRTIHQKLWHRRRLSPGGHQIRALFNHGTWISFRHQGQSGGMRFCETHPREPLFGPDLGIAAPGRSPKVVVLRVTDVARATARLSHR
jgi:hypothetical protein